MSQAPRRRPGRPSTASRTDRREAIVAAAAQEFAANGFARTSIRQVARTAGVDPALVHHYFAGKEELFFASLHLPVNPLEVIASALPGLRAAESFGTELLRVIVPVWDRPEVSSRLSAIVRSISDQPEVAALVEEFVRDRLAPAVLGRTAEGRAPALSGTVFARFHAVMVGLLTDRFVARTHPLVEMTAEEVAEAFGPLLDAALAGALPAPDTAET